MSGIWVDTDVANDIKKETDLIISIISDLSCNDLKQSERILIYCLDYLRSNNPTPGLPKNYRDLLKEMDIKDIPEE